METESKEKVTSKIKEEVKKEPIEIVLANSEPYTENYRLIVKDKAGYKNNVYIFKYPTNNCQLSSIGQATNLLTIVEDRAMESMTLLRRRSCAQVLIDIRSEYRERMLKFLEPYTTVVTETPYHSSNGSNMILFIMKWAI